MFCLENDGPVRNRMTSINPAVSTGCESLEPHAQVTPDKVATQVFEIIRG